MEPRSRAQFSGLLPNSPRFRVYYVSVMGGKEQRMRGRGDGQDGRADPLSGTDSEVTWDHQVSLRE